MLGAGDALTVAADARQDGIHQAFEDFRAGRLCGAPAVRSAPTALLVTEIDWPLD